VWTKQAGAKVTWYDPVKDQTRECNLTSIQVTSQSSLTGVVFRAVGMMYLVDLDDTPGYTLIIVWKLPAPEKVEMEAPKKPKAKAEAALLG
jgi:hypothetical protein